MHSILPQVIVNSIIAGSIYALVGLGFTMIFRTAKFFDLGYGALTAVGGYMVFLLYKKFDFPLIVGVVIAIVITALIGLLMDKVIYTRLRERKASNMVLLVASLGAFTAIQAILAIFFTSQFQTLVKNGAPARVIQIAGAYITETQLIIVVTAILLTIGLVVLLRYTMLGKSIRAISDDVEVAKIVGINTQRVIGYVFFIGAAIAGLSGVLVGFDTGIEPTMGMALLLKGVIAAIIGGAGSIGGAVIGAFLLAFVENFAVLQVSGEWKDAIAFGLLIIFLLFRPKGIIGT